MTKTDLITVVDAIYASVLDPERWPESLKYVSDISGGLGATIVTFAPNKVMTVASSSMDEANQSYVQEWWRHDIREERRTTLGITAGLITDSDLVDDQISQTHPFFQEFLRPQGLGARIGYVARLPSMQTVIVGVHRSLRRGPFEKEHEDNFARLAPHAAQAITAAAEIAEARRASCLLGNSLDRVACGAVLLDDQGVVVSMNETAQSMMGAEFSIFRGRLSVATARDQKALDDLVVLALSGQALLMRAQQVLVRSAKGEQILVQVIPVTGNEQTTFEYLALRPGVLVLVKSLSSLAPEEIQHRLIQLGLTRGQARVAMAVGSGQSSKAAAEQLKLTDGTVRTVLKGVYERLGISRQSQLVALVTQIGSAPLID
ncbi:helix-turn-helix transcriptional regulator [Microvirga sp. P5_D2]